VKSDLVASTIVAMVKGEDPSPGAPSEPLDPSPRPAEPHAQGGSDPSKMPRGPLEGEPVSAICPECGGVLSERPAAGVVQWECRVGHRFSRDTLLEAQAESVESALWAAVRALNDRAILLRRMAEQSDKRGQQRSARRFRRQADSASEQAQIVIQALTGAANTTLRRVEDDDDDGVGEEGAA
jgi:two-component system, chemotaxis family, protein-glutamate methylesterase/glutaminase